MSARAHLAPAEALVRLAALRGPEFTLLFRHGTLEIEVYRPHGVDRQQPHRRDEAYVVISGHGSFVNGDTRKPFAPGDLLFVQAGAAHRFEDFSEDFATWVIFYGPEGGERDAAD